MKVRIINVSEPSFWYADKIGEVYEVHKNKKFGGWYVVIGANNMRESGLNIKEEDCEIISQGIVEQISNERKIRRFPTGAIRSDNTGRERFDFISPLALKELAQFLSTTENAFAQVNYFLGIPEEACIESALRHINDFRINGKKEEAVALLFNTVALVHTIALKERGEYKQKYKSTELITETQFKNEQKV